MKFILPFIFSTIICMPMLNIFIDYGEIAYLLLILFMIPAVILNFFKKEFEINNLLHLALFNIFSIYSLFSASWSNYSINTTKEFYQLFYLSSLSFITFFTVSAMRIDLFIRLIIIYAMFGALFSLYSGVSYGNYEYIIEHNFNESINLWISYLVIGLVVSSGAISSFCLFINSISYKKYVYFIFSMILLFALFGMRGRSLILFTLITIILIMISYSKHYILNRANKCKFHNAFKIAVSFFLIFFCVYFSFFKGNALSRFKLLYDNGFKSDLRFEQIKKSFISIDKFFLFGNGLGSSGILSGNVDGGYPHNFILQVILDSGFINLILLLTWLMLPIIKHAINSRNATQINNNSMILLMMYLIYILEYMKSFDFYTSRPIIILGILLFNHKEK